MHVEILRRAPWGRRSLAVLATLSMMVGLLIAVAVRPAAAAVCQPYPDVNSSNPHCVNIEWLRGQAITKPADGYYHPLNDVTRGSMTAFLFRLTNPGKASPACADPFPDVNAGNVFCGYISWAEQNGIAQGYPDGSFGSDRPVTRGAMAAFLHRVATGRPAPQCDPRAFADVPSYDVFCGVITWMKNNGITYGVGDGTNYGTAQPVNRQSMASFLHRIATLMGIPDRPAVPNTPVTPQKPSTPKPPSTPQTPSTHSFSDGMHRVGTDVAPGLYRTKIPAGEMCYWERLSDASGKLSSIISNQLIQGYALIPIDPSDAFVNSERCGTWRLVSESPAWNFHGSIPGDGMFLVGVDIQPGTYHQTKSDCYWERDRAATGLLSDIIVNDYTSGPSYVTIQPTDAVFATSRCSTFTRVG